MTGFGTSDELIRRYINPGNPLGPIDTDLIEHDAVKAELFDPHYASFNKLLSRDVNVVIGRRGAGKTALLNCYRHRWFLKNTEARGSFAPSFDLSDYNLVFFTPVHTAFETLQLSVMGANQIVRPIESVVSSWDALISDFLLLKIVESTDTNKAPECATILQYLGRQDTIDRQEAHDAIWGSKFDRVNGNGVVTNANRPGHRPPGNKQWQRQKCCSRRCSAGHSLSLIQWTNIKWVINLPTVPSER